jgi:RimJ/RimL family protein N-acetyltransferase
MIETQRLLLRRWRDADLPVLAAIHADAEVMDWMGSGPLSADQSAAFVARAEAEFEALGHGLFAVERKADARLVGFLGLSAIRHGPPAPQGVEFVWGLARAAWGAGMATEGARAVMTDGLGRLNLEEIFAYTSRGNLRSQAVMRRVGLHRRPELDFDHPALAPDHPLRPHVVFSTIEAAPARIAASRTMG